MKVARITFQNGQMIETNINGTTGEIKAYYLGQEFNLGYGEQDLMTKAVHVEIVS